MFEKEAEDYSIDTYETCVYDNLPYMNDLRAREESFRDGATFGYNKANEWHFVKDELPPKKVPLNIITFDKNKKRRVWVGEYDGGNGQWWTGYFNHFIDVPYAWREIVLPKEN